MSDPQNPSPEAVAQLQSQVDDLKTQVAALRASIHDARQHMDLTMRGQTCCPACGCTRIAHAMSILDRGESDGRRSMSLYKASWWSGKTVGQLEAYACTRCGLLEWYVKDPSTLKPHDKYMRILERTEPEAQGPYR